MWIPAEQHQRREHLLGEEVQRRLRMEREENPVSNWNSLVETNIPMPPEGLPPEEMEETESESDKESDVVPLTLRRTHQHGSGGTRRQPSRRSKQPINYKGMFAHVNEMAEVDKETTSDIVDADCAF